MFGNLFDCKAWNFSLSYVKDVDISLRCKQQGYKYCSENYIHAVSLFKGEENVIQVAAKCYRSMRKSEKPHLVHLDIGQEKIDMSNCSCVAGLGGNCSHVVGVILSLEHWQMLGLSEPPAELSSTSFPQQWSVPRGPKIQPVPAPKLVVVKPKPDRKRKPVKNNLDDNRKIRVNKSDVAHLQSLHDYTIGYLTQSNTAPVNTHLGTVVNTHLGTVPLGSGLSTHAEFYVGVEILPIDTVCGNLVFPKPSSVILESYANEIDYMTFDDAYAVEEKTRKQSDSSAWYSERKFRLTASTFHLISKSKAPVTDKFVNSFINPVCFSNAATVHGKKSEPKARISYVNDTGNHVHDCGFCVNPAFPFIGASPDAKVCEKGQTGLLEIKCPSSVKDCELSVASQNRAFCLEMTENGLKLKREHNYFVQVQGQLLVTGAPFCDFYVYTSVESHLERIYPDQQYMKTLLDKLSDFYFSHIRPVMLNLHNASV